MTWHEVLRPALQGCHRQHYQRPNNYGHEAGQRLRGGARWPPSLGDMLIDTIDADGVALAAIQGLHEVVQEKDARISSLEARIEGLETSVEKLVESQAGGE